MAGLGRGGPEYRRGGMNPRDEMSLLFNRLESLLLPGRIIQVDYDAEYARVDLGSVKTDWIRWCEPSGDNREWNPPNPGEACLIASPTGNLNLAIIIATYNTQTFPANCSNPNINRKTWGKAPGQSFFEAPFWEVDKTKGAEHEWFYLPENGVIRKEIGEKGLFYMDKDSFIIRIGNTQFSIEDGNVSLSIADNVTSPTKLSQIVVSSDGVMAHVNNQVKLTLTDSDIAGKLAEIYVGDKSVVSIDEAGIRMANESNLTFTMAAGEINLENKQHRSQLRLGLEQAKLSLDDVALNINPDAIQLGFDGSALLINPAMISLGSSSAHIPVFDEHVESEHPTVTSKYDLGPDSPSPVMTKVKAPLPIKSRWSLSEGKGPRYPRTGKAKQ